MVESDEAALACAAQDFAAGRLAAAGDACRTVLARRPEQPSALRQLALIHVVLREFEAALQLLPSAMAAFPADPMLHLGLAEALWGTEGPAAAVPHFQAALELDPARPRVRARLGLALLGAERPGEALTELEAVVEALPEWATALTHLGMAAAATGAIERAISHFESALAFDPADADAAFQLGQTLRATGRLDAAIVALREAVRRDPGTAFLRVALGDALMTRGQLDDAIDELRAGVRLGPDWATAWTALGRALQQRGQLKDAIIYYRTAQAIDEALPNLDALLGTALYESGATAEGHAHFARSMARARWATSRAPSDTPPSDRLRVGLLMAPGAANTPIDFILDRSLLDIEPVFMLDDFAYPFARIDASYDVLFNVAADVDKAGPALRRAIVVAAALNRPILNPPSLVIETGRDRMATRLAGIDHCIMPPTRRYDGAALRSPGMAEAIARDIGFPCLVRPLGSHGGTDLAKVDSAAALLEQLDFGRFDAVYLTRFHDFRSPDGRYRKYRFIFVDGEIYPYHLAISDEWLVHYFRTPMEENAALLAEEARFLEDYETALGPHIPGVLREIMRRVPLDFFGIDCTIDGSGNLLLFECNSVMLVHGETADVFAYKHPFAAAIRDAVSRMLQRRAFSPAGSSAR